MGDDVISMGGSWQLTPTTMRVESGSRTRVVIRMMVAVEPREHLDCHAEVSRSFPRNRAALHHPGRARVA